MPFVFFLIFFSLASVIAFSQRDTTHSIHTEVFTLSSCEPNLLSFSSDSLLKKYSKPRRELTKLETHSNALSAIAITGINPLRYKYFINNEAITQFMDASASPLAINTFIDGQYLNVAPEIKIPEIFKTDSIAGNVRSTIRSYQSKIETYKDSMEYFQSVANDRYYEVYDKTFTEELAHHDSIASNRTALAKAMSDIEWKKLDKKVAGFKKKYESTFTEYQVFTSNLPINDPTFGILANYRTRTLNSSDSLTNIDLWNIENVQKAFAYRYNSNIQDFKEIDSLLTEIKQRGGVYTQGNPVYRNLWDSLEIKLRYYNFVWPETTSYDFYYHSSQETFDNKIASVREQVLNKKFQLYEEFVLNVATMVGVHVQNIFREYARFNNELQSLNCVDYTVLDSVKKMKEKLVRIFEFIQQTSAELQVMVSYLDINTDLYESIAKKVNNNYVFLLQYLKNLDYVCKTNSVQFTLPTHTNLRNIDLVRYTVRREDKITNGSQTYNYDFWIRGGIKVDFSVGFFGTALTDNTYNKVLLDTIGGIDSTRITRQDRGDYSFAFGGMVNITPRNGASWLNVGGSIGIAYSNTNQLQVLSGLSLHFGKTERLILHGGFAFGNVKYLDISANDFKFYDRTDLSKKVSRETLQDVPEGDRVYILRSPDIKFSSYIIPMVDRFVARPFIGVSYNLSKRNALQAVAGNGATTFGNNLKAGLQY